MGLAFLVYILGKLLRSSCFYERSTYNDEERKWKEKVTI